MRENTTNNSTNGQSNLNLSGIARYTASDEPKTISSSVNTDKKKPYWNIDFKKSARQVQEVNVRVIIQNGVSQAKSPKIYASMLKQDLNE